MQYENKQYELNIDILALFVDALRKWKVLLLAVVIGAVLLGLYAGTRQPAGMTAEEIDATVQMEMDALQDELDILQNELTANMDALLANEDSITNNENIINLSKKEIEENQELLLDLYQSRQMLEDLLSSLKAASAQSQEVIADLTASAEERSEAIMQLSVLVEEIISVDNQLNAVTRQIYTAENEIRIWTNDINTIERKNETLKEDNEDLQNQIAEQEEQLEIAEQEGQQRILELENQLKTVSSAALPKSVVRYAVIGAALGVFVFCCVVFFRYVFVKKLRSSQELKEWLRVPVLGEFESAAAQKHGKFDKMLDKLVGDVSMLPEEQQVYGLIATGIQVASGTELPQAFVVTGTVQETILQETGDHLQALLPKEYKITVAANPVYNAAFLAKLKQSTVVLVEAKGVSDVREIVKLKEVLARNEVNVIGAIVR